MEGGADPRGTFVEHYLAFRRLELSSDLAGPCLGSTPPVRGGTRPGAEFAPAMLAVMRTSRRMNSRRFSGRRSIVTAPSEGAHARRSRGRRDQVRHDDAVTTGLIVGEGAETVLSGRQVGFRPAWALGSAGAIATLPVPSGIEALSIHAEHDDTGANARASRNAEGDGKTRAVSSLPSRLGSATT